MAEKLAIDGGPKSVTECLTPWPQMSEEAIKAVEEVLRSGKVNYWTGPKGQQFELEFAKWQGSNFGISVNSGTSALHVAMAAAGIGPGDEVIVPSYTFIATSFSVVQAGAIPRFADVNIDDHCISLESAEKLDGAADQGHHAGPPVWKRLRHGPPDGSSPRSTTCWSSRITPKPSAASYKGRKTGTIGDIAACSFCQNKTFTTGGEGRHGHDRQRRLRLGGRGFRDHGYDVKQRMNHAGTRTEAALHPQPHRLELPHDRDAVGHRPGRVGANRRLEPARPENETPIFSWTPWPSLPQVLKYMPIDTEERQNGWFVCAFTLDIDNMNCDVAQFVSAAGAEGGALLEGLLAPMPRRKSLHPAQRLRQQRLPLQLKGIHRPGKRRLQQSRRPQRRLAREPHVHVFRLPDVHGREYEADRGGVGEGD